MVKNQHIRNLLSYGSGYFNVDGVLLLETIMLSPLMCVYVAIIALILAVMLRNMDYAAALKCSGCRLESWLAVHLEKGSCTGGQGLVFKCIGLCGLVVHFFLLYHYN